jgi:hypothetical protein
MCSIIPSDKKQEQPTHFKDELISWMNEWINGGQQKQNTWVREKLMSHDMDEKLTTYNKMVIDYIQSHMIHMDDSH